MTNIYTDHGYESRKDYFLCLAQDNGLDYATVKSLADLLGPSEDFDGLVVACEDAHYWNQKP